MTRDQNVLLLPQCGLTLAAMLEAVKRGKVIYLSEVFIYFTVFTEQ